MRFFLFQFQLSRDSDGNGVEAKLGENRKERQMFCIERPTYLKKCFMKDRTPLSARFRSLFKPSGSPAVHFWVLQARNCSERKHSAQRDFLTHFLALSFFFFSPLFERRFLSDANSASDGRVRMHDKSLPVGHCWNNIFHCTSAKHCSTEINTQPEKEINFNVSSGFRVWEETLGQVSAACLSCGKYEM